jgi:hypothetical protein
MTDPTGARSAARRALLLSYRDAGTEAWIGLDGSSMAPVIPRGATALVDFGRREPSVGSVAVADVGGRVVAHRVIAAPTRRRPDRYLLKGDAEPFADPRVGRDGILGTVLAIRNRDGRVSAAGLGGRRAHAIAIASRLTTRGLRAAMPLAGLLPPAARRSTSRILVAMAGMPVRILAVSPRLGERIALQEERR